MGISIQEKPPERQEEQSAAAQQLLSAAECLRDYLDSLRGISFTVPMAILDALGRQTREQLARGADVEDARFTPDELVEQIWQAGLLKTGNPPRRCEQKDPAVFREECGRWIRRNRKALDRFVEEIREPLIAQATAAGRRFFPSIASDAGGGSGRQTRYRIEPTAVEEDVSAVSSFPPPALAAGEIAYRVERVPRLPPWARWLDNFVLTGWRRWFLLVALMTPLLVLGLAFMLMVFVLKTIGWLAGLNLLIAVGVMSAMGWLLLGPLYQVQTLRVVIAPAWWSWRESPVLERRPSPDGAAHDVLRLAVYSGTCPICQGRVEVEPGGWAFPGRLVGKCRNSPREHVFSFDHITLRGRALR